MRSALGLLLHLVMLSGLAQPAQGADPAYVVSYVEALPAARSQVAVEIRKFARNSRTEAGNVRFDVLVRTGYPGQFAVLETWADAQAQTAHAEAAHTKEFRDRLQALLRAPYDERQHHVLAVGPGSATAGKGAIYVVTHVDVPGKVQAEGAEAVKALSEASRGDKGNLRFDGLTQTSRPNHMTLIEVWKDQGSMDAHVTAAHTKLFREKLHPLSGSLYDERWYRVLD